MKTIKIILMITLIGACSKTPENPTVSIAEYSKQVVVMNGVIDKILAEQDPKKMNQMADAVEATRVVACKPVLEECNLYYKIINKVVLLTKEGNITSDQRMELFKMRNEFQEEIRKGEAKIREIWRLKINKN